MRESHFSGDVLAQRLLLLLIAFEFLAFICSGVSFSFLHGDPFFSIGVDPLYWFFYALNIPQFIIAHQWAGIGADIFVMLLLCLLIKKPSNQIIAWLLLPLMILFYVTLTGYHTHRNFQTGFFLVLVPFSFKALQSRQLAYNALRYFLLFFYFSSAVLKLSSSSIFDADHFSTILQQQFVPYYLEGNTGWRTSINAYLVDHSALTYVLFLTGIVIEGTTIAGFFTKKFDRFLGFVLICFHLVNWILMDIAPLGQLSFICLLFMGRVFNKQ